MMLATPQGDLLGVLRGAAEVTQPRAFDDHVSGAVDLCDEPEEDRLRLLTVQKGWPEEDVVSSQPEEDGADKGPVDLTGLATENGGPGAGSAHSPPRDGADLPRESA